MIRRRGVALCLALLASAVTAASTTAHPLGNFTINHYTGVRIAPDSLLVDRVLDMAEIPAFQEWQAMDADADDDVSEAEATAYRDSSCRSLAETLLVSVDGTPVSLRLVGADIRFPEGVGGLVTLRLVCLYEADLGGRVLGAGRRIEVRDDAYAERIGWREIVVEGDGVAVEGEGVTSVGVSERLTVYPEDLLALPLDVRSVAIRLGTGGGDLPPLCPVEIGDRAPGCGAAPVPTPSAGGGPFSLPGGLGEITEEISALIGTAELTPPVVGVSLLIALGLGALHAVSPGHGKTVMAAYLAGTRGTTRQAFGLGLTVTLSHTLGVLLLGLVTISASSLIAPEQLYPILGLASGLIVLAIGVVLVTRRVLDWHVGRQPGVGDAHTHGHDHENGHAHDHGDGHEHAAAEAHAHDEPHEHAHPHPHPRDEQEAGWHSHGPFRHSHIAAVTDDPLSWRGLFALGLSGGLVPSASAVILLLGSINLGRPVYGLVLIIAFGLGMATVLVAVGVLLVRGRALLDRIPSRGARRLARTLPAATAVMVLVIGLLLTGGAAVQLLA